MDYSAPGLPVLHQLPEFTQSHIHRVSDANESFDLNSGGFGLVNVFTHKRPND